MAFRLLLVPGIMLGCLSCTTDGLRPPSEIGFENLSSRSRLFNADVAGALHPGSKSISSIEDPSSDGLASSAKDTLQELDLSFVEASSGVAGHKSLEAQLQSEADALQQDLVVATRLKNQLGKMKDSDKQKATVRQKLEDLRKKRGERNARLDTLLSEATAPSKSPKASKKLQGSGEAASLKKLAETIKRSRTRLEEALSHK